jgi:hypothetical protein
MQRDGERLYRRRVPLNQRAPKSGEKKNMQVVSNRAANKNTDPHARLALQLASQLPENIEAARAVLDETGKVLETVLIKVPREVWTPRARPTPPVPAPRLVHCRALAITLCGALLLAPIAAAATWETGIEALFPWIMLGGVAAAALTFGALYGVLFALLASLADNLLVVPPLLQLTAPTLAEAVRLIGFISLALLLPVIADSAHRWRAIATAGAAAHVPAALSPD